MKLHTTGWRRLVPPALCLVLFALFAGGWSRVNCDNNTADVPESSPSGTDASAAGAGARCKYNLKNIRENHFITDKAFLIYYGGNMSDWCWRADQIRSRHTDFPHGYTSLVNSGSIGGYVWSSGCAADYSNCLVRSEWLARMEATVPGFVSVTVGINEFFCAGTRIWAFSGQNHSRNLTGGRCPGSNTATASVAQVGSDGSLSGVMGRVLSQAEQQEVVDLAFSPTNLRHMQHTGSPSPKLRRKLLALYQGLTPAQRAEVRRGIGQPPPEVRKAMKRIEEGGR